LLSRQKWEDGVFGRGRVKREVLLSKKGKKGKGRAVGGNKINAAKCDVGVAQG